MLNSLAICSSEAVSESLGARRPHIAIVSALGTVLEVVVARDLPSVLDDGTVVPGAQGNLYEGYLHARSCAAAWPQSNNGRRCSVTNTTRHG